MEFPHHRHRVIKVPDRPGTVLRAFWDGLRSKDEDALSEYLFLQQAGEDLSAELDRAQEKLRKNLLFCGAVCLLLFLALALLGRETGDLSELLLRPAAGETDKSVTVSLDLDWQGESLQQDVTLDIPARNLTRQEANALLSAAEQWLRTEVFGKKQDLTAVTKDLRSETAAER